MNSAALTLNAKAAEVDGAAPMRILSVRSKGFLVVGALVVYALLLSIFAFYQKSETRNQFNEIQRLLETDAQLKDADVAIFYAMMAIIAHNSSPESSLMPVHATYMELREQNSELAVRVPTFKSALVGSDAALAAAAKVPSSENKNRLLAELAKVEQRYLQYGDQLAGERKRKADELRTRADSTAMTMLWFGILGLAFLSFVTGSFFKHLTIDLNALQMRALDIVNGTRSQPLKVTRHDEVGRLMSAVNSMGSALDARERELLLERQKYFHQEKMAAIGVLAAGVAHEIGNPIAAIAGVAQEMMERCASGGDCGWQESCKCRPDLIYAQTHRLAAITREISELASPQQAGFQLLDLNAQLRSTSHLIRYDKRLERLELRLDLDSQLPAVYGIADQLTQMIMNLLINAMDAVDDMQGRAALITVSTRLEGDQVCMTVEDNGHGMDEKVLGRAFDPFFTTKPAGKGTGLGLALCYSIMQSHGGSIEIESTPGLGTRVKILFPNEVARDRTESA